MKVDWIEWNGPRATANASRQWAFSAWPDADVDPIDEAFKDSTNRDETLLELAARFDAAEPPRESLEVTAEERAGALSSIEEGLRVSLEVAARNIEAVAEAQLAREATEVQFADGQSVTIREVPLGAAGIYAPGGRAAYPSSVLMCAIPARVAGVGRIALATPPDRAGNVNTAVLAAAEICGVNEIYAMGGAQAIFALAYGTETIPNVDAVAGPGNAWVREAKARVARIVAIDSLAGPSELMIAVDRSANLEWAALDLCAQAEHGAETPLVIIGEDKSVLTELAKEARRIAASRAGFEGARLAVVKVPTFAKAIEFINIFAPEHLQLMVENPGSIVAGTTTAGCVFVGNSSGTVFGDYVAGSNHVLPTSGAGRFSGPLGPGTFRRRIATVEIPPDAAAKLAPHADRISRAEGFPVHGESAMIRSEDR